MHTFNPLSFQVLHLAFPGAKMLNRCHVMMGIHRKGSNLSTQEHVHLNPASTTLHPQGHMEIGHASPEKHNTAPACDHAAYGRTK